MSELTVDQANKLYEQLKHDVDGLTGLAVTPMNSRIVLRVGLGLPTEQITPQDEPYLVRTATYTTDSAVRTYVKAVESAVVVNGVYGSEPTTFNASLNLAPSAFVSALELVCSLRDTGSDREFSNTWMPLSVLASGWAQGHRFGRGHVFLSPGAEVKASVGVTFFNPASLTVIDITSIDVVITLVGFTVPAE